MVNEAQFETRRYVFGQPMMQFFDGLAASCKLILFVIVADAAASNLLLLKKLSIFMKYNTLATVLFFSERCGLHQCGRIVASSTKDSKIQGPLYSLSKLAKLQKFKTDVRSGLRALLNTHGKFLYLRSPPPADAELTRYRAALRLCCNGLYCHARIRKLTHYGSNLCFSDTRNL